MNNISSFSYAGKDLIMKLFALGISPPEGYNWGMAEFLNFLSSSQDQVLLGFLFTLLVLSYQEYSKERRELLRVLLGFHREIQINRVSARVMLDTEKFVMLEQNFLSAIKNMPTFPLQKTIAFYSLEITYVNATIADYLMASQHYGLSFQNRTSDNANAVNSKRDRIKNELKDFEATMVDAEKTMKDEITKLRAISPDLTSQSKLVKIFLVPYRAFERFIARRPVCRAIFISIMSGFFLIILSKLLSK
jgi:hypothetical protein